jgi:16S rRNA (adenine1518-N6/adenine1519-N6)-dimethyltransferase
MNDISVPINSMNDISVPTQDDIILLSKRVRTHKGLGQNFLIDIEALDCWLDFLESLPSAAIYVEIGPGTGILTELILQQKPVQYYGIDLDARWIHWIASWKSPVVQLIQADVIGYNFSEILTPYAQEPKILVGNIPYHISGPLMIQLIYQSHNQNIFFETIALLVQKEVAQRLSSTVSGALYGRLSVLTQLIFDVKIIATWKPHIFIPQPSVDSSLIVFNRHPNEKYMDTEKLLPLIDRITRLCFQNRRKIIRTVLEQNGFSKNIIEQFGQKRAQELSVEDYILLARSPNNFSQ